MRKKIVKLGNIIANRATSGFRIQKSLLDERPQTYTGPNKSYQKFIVLTHARSGSSMVVGSLGKHPDIIRFGEIFRGEKIGFLAEGFDNNSKQMIRLRKKYPIEFLQRQIFTSYPANIKAVGFKLFPEQLDNRHFRCVWDWIIANKTIRIILLTRDNLLEAYVSKLIAKKTRNYWILDDSDRTSATVHVDCKQCLAAFRERSVYRQKALEQLKNHELLCLTYEEMVRDIDGSFRRLQEYLGVSVQPLTVGSVKQEVRSMPKVIENYAELRERFSNTQWEYLFNE